VLNPNASRWQRIGAGLSLLSELAPVSVSDLKDARRVGAAISAGRSGRLGNQRTRDHVHDVGTELQRRCWTVTRGGDRFPEEYLPGPGGARRGSSYPDITATKGDRTLRVNTVDTYADGVTPTAREAANAARIRAQTGEHVLFIPKPK
jgi:hypothetical protein